LPVKSNGDFGIALPSSSLRVVLDRDHP